MCAAPAAVSASSLDCWPAGVAADDGSGSGCTRRPSARGAQAPHAAITGGWQQSAGQSAGTDQERRNGQQVGGRRDDLEVFVGDRVQDDGAESRGPAVWQGRGQVLPAASAGPGSTAASRPPAARASATSPSKCPPVLGTPSTCTMPPRVVRPVPGKAGATMARSCRGPGSRARVPRLLQAHVAPQQRINLLEDPAVRGPGARQPP